MNDSILNFPLIIIAMNVLVLLLALRIKPLQPQKIKSKTKAIVKRKFHG